MSSNPNVFNDLDADLNHVNALYPDFNNSASSLYYNFSKLNSVFSDRNLCFSIIHFNIRSLFPKLDEIRTELSNLIFQFDLLCFTESWMSESLRDLVVFEKYNAYRNVRLGRRGGGVSVFV